MKFQVKEQFLLLYLVILVLCKIDLKRVSSKVFTLENYFHFKLKSRIDDRTQLLYQSFINLK